MPTSTTVSLSEALSHGYGLQQRGDPAAAVDIYRRVIAERPENAEAWCYLGMANYDLGHFRESEDAYLQALKFRPKFPVVWNNLGNTLRVLGKVEEAMEAFVEAVRQKPGYLNALRNKAAALYWAGRMEVAEEGFTGVLAENGEDAEARKSLGVLRLLAGRFREGWPDYEYRWKAPGMTELKIPGKRWKGEGIEGRTLMLVAEQGLGDTIHFLRYGKFLKEHFGCRVIARIQDPLVPLISGSAELMGLDEVEGIKGALPVFDVWAPLLSVPGILDQTESDFPREIPYLKVGGEDAIAPLLAGFSGVKVGVAWQGSPANRGDRERSFPLDALAPMAGLDGVTLFSLQKGSGEGQLKLLGKALGVVDLGSQLDNTGGAFLETAAVMNRLDLVVTADTAVAHLAGALGVPVWLALSHVPDWRWGLGSDDTVWYPTMRLFRQRDPRDWKPVIADMVQELVRAYPQLSQRPIPQVATLEIPIPPGELVDRMTILEIKEERIKDEGKRGHVRTELAALRKVREAAFGDRPVAEIEVLAIRLREINAELWDVEDVLREMESKRSFSSAFISAARSVYRLNDERAALKGQLNDLLGAAWQEAKSYGSD